MLVSPYAGIDGDVKPDRFSGADGNGLWQITTSADSLVPDIHHICSGCEAD
jgi:hypothetical protein